MFSNIRGAAWRRASAAGVRFPYKHEIPLIE